MSRTLPANREDQIPIEEAFIKSLEDSGLFALPIDLAEAELDTLIADDLIRGIPIVGTVVSLAKFGRSISNSLFIKKLLRFIVEFSTTSKEERVRIVDKLNQGKKPRRKIAENLLLAIDRHDQFEKAEVLARIFKSYLLEQIDEYQFNKLVTVLDRINIIDIPLLVEFYKSSKSRDTERDSHLADLLNIGLVSLEYPNMAISDIIPDPSFVQNSLGKLLFHFSINQQAHNSSLGNLPLAPEFVHLL